MALGLVGRGARALSAHLNQTYRVLKGIDPDSVALRLPVGGTFEVRHSTTGLAVFLVADWGIMLPPGAIDSTMIQNGTIKGEDIENATITSDKLAGGIPVPPASITSEQLAAGAATRSDGVLFVNKSLAGTTTVVPIAGSTVNFNQTVQSDDLLLCSGSATFTAGAVGASAALSFVIDSTPYNELAQVGNPGLGISVPFTLVTWAPSVAAGNRNAYLQWRVNAVGTTFNITLASVTVLQLRR